jgi:hypothetical protein
VVDDRVPTPAAITSVRYRQRPASPGRYRPPVPTVADQVVQATLKMVLIVGPSIRSAIRTLVERRSRYLLLVHLPAGDSAEQCRRALAAVLRALRRCVERRAHRAVRLHTRNA